MNSARLQLFHGSGLPFEARSVPLPERLGPGEVLVRISLATICGSDLHTVDGRRPAPCPCVLGHEAVGEVVSGNRTGVTVGQRVTAGQRIALMGSEGDSTGVHLHLRVRVGTSTSVRGIDPAPYLRDRGVGLPCTPGGGGGGGGTSVTAWTQANVRACASTSCDIKSTVYPGQTYPAHCWVAGQKITLHMDLVITGVNKPVSIPSVG